jgi:hypothetical protein
MDDVRKLVKVKPLEWKDWSARHRVIVVASEYTITQRNFPDMHFVIERFGRKLLPPSDTLEDAKAAAQADYEARIYAALTPASDGRAEGLREAAEMLSLEVKKAQRDMDRYKGLGRKYEAREASHVAHVLSRNFKAILARAAELEAPTEYERKVAQAKEDFPNGF